MRLAIGDGVALFLIVLSWYEASGTVSTSTSVAWFKAGIVGLVVAGTSNALWLLRGRKAVGLARVALLEQFAPVGATDTASTRAKLVALPSSRRYHRDGCPMVRGKAVSVLANDVAPSTRVPCEVCRP